jgi:hypothetical protein
MYDAYFAERDLIEGHLQVAFESLELNPLSEVRRIYAEPARLCPGRAG